MEDYKVTSEIYDEFDYKSLSKPMISKEDVVSKFKFKYPPPKATVDSDGDLVPSRSKSPEKWGTIEIEHQKSTILELVGLQIWRGALLLADWLLHNGDSLQKDHYVLELGAGVGFTSIIASMFAPVFCTDVNKGGLFKIIKSNCLRNKHLTKFPVNVLELDFTWQTLPQDIVKTLAKTPIIIAADVIYDDLITEAFVKTVQHLLAKPPQKSIYVCVEKRFVFTLAEFDSAAPCYEYFIDCLNNAKDIQFETVPIDFPQYFQYDRVKELVLLKITSKVHNIN